MFIVQFLPYKSHVWRNVDEGPTKEEEVALEFRV